MQEVNKINEERNKHLEKKAGELDQYKHKLAEKKNERRGIMFCR